MSLTFKHKLFLLYLLRYKKLKFLNIDLTYKIILISSSLDEIRQRNFCTVTLFGYTYTT
jgi:hypothetical protein